MCIVHCFYFERIMPKTSLYKQYLCIFMFQDVQELSRPGAERHGRGTEACHRGARNGREVQQGWKGRFRLKNVIDPYSENPYIYIRDEYLKFFSTEPHPLSWKKNYGSGSNLKSKLRKKYILLGR